MINHYKQKNLLSCGLWRGATLSSLLTVSLSILLSGHVYAQDGQRKSRLSTSLEEIVVTARKREENLQDTPIAITAFSGEGLEVRGITNISEIGAITPNLLYTNTPGAGGSTSLSLVYIRGIGQRDFLGTIDNGVGFYIDDVYIARTVGATVELMDIERIEVLKGPQGTLFGRNNIGGAMKLHSKKPTEELEGYVTGTVGTDGLGTIKAAINMPFSDTLLSKFSVLKSVQDGYVDNPNGDLGDNDVTSLRGSLLWLPSDSVEVSLTADYSDENDSGAPIVLVNIDPAGSFSGFYNNVVAGADCNYAEFGVNRDNPNCINNQFVNGGNEGGQSFFSDTETKGVRLGVDWDINDSMTFKSITAYRDLDSSFSRDRDGSPINVFLLEDVFRSEQFSQEFQLLGSAFDDQLDWITGLYYFDEDGFNQNLLTFPIASFDSQNGFGSTSKAVFAQATWHMTDQWHLTLGGRYTDEEKTFDPVQVVQSSRIGFPPGFPILPLGENKISATETSPLLNIAYDVSDDLMVYATYSEGFRSGGFTQRIFPPLPAVPSFDPEFVDSVELGFKYSNQDGSLTLNGALFTSDYNDIQVTVPNGVASVEENIGTAAIDGFELELKWAPADSWFFEAGVGYTDARYTEIDINIEALRRPDGTLVSDITDPTVVIQLDTKLDRVPEWSANVSLSKEFDLGSNGSLLSRFGGTWHTEYFNDPRNAPASLTPDTDLWDLTFLWTSYDESYNVNFGIKNLTDEEWVHWGADFLGFHETIFDRGRQWYLTGTANF